MNLLTVTYRQEIITLYWKRTETWGKWRSTQIFRWKFQHCIDVCAFTQLQSQSLYDTFALTVSFWSSHRIVTGQASQRNFWKRSHTHEFSILQKWYFWCVIGKDRLFKCCLTSSSLTRNSQICMLSITDDCINYGLKM